MKIEQNNILAPPTIPQSINDVIDYNTLVQDYIYVGVPFYKDMVNGNIISVYFGDITTTPYLMMDAYSPAPIYLEFPKGNIANGNYDVYYVITQADGDATYSPTVNCTIINSSVQFYPAPTFTDYPLGIIPIQSVVDAGAITVQAQYSYMSIGDVVQFDWYGTDAYGNPIPASYYKSDPIIVTDEMVEKNIIQSEILSKYIICLNNYGIGYLNYRVSQRSFNINQSPFATAVFIWFDINNLDLLLSTGAPFNTPEFSMLQCQNFGSVFGPPTAIVSISLSGNGVITNAVNPQGPYDIELNKDGFGTFSVYTLNQSNHTVAVYAHSLNFDTKDTSSSTEFATYKVGQAGIKAYGYTTGAASDGVMPCSIYIIADDNINAINASITGSALINGWSNILVTQLNSDNSATLNIVNNVVETCTLKLYASGQQADPLSITISFIDTQTVRLQ